MVYYLRRIDERSCLMVPGKRTADCFTGAAASDFAKTVPALWKYL